MSAEIFAAARRSLREQGDGAALVALVPYARFLGVQMTAVEGQWRCRLPFKPTLIGNAAIQALHGGVTAAFMENAALLHLLGQLDETRIPKSINFSLDYLAPGRAEDSYAQCEVSRAGLRVAQVQVTCWQSKSNRPIAKARGHFLLGPGRS